MNWQLCKKILVVIALIFSIAGISLIMISEDMYNLNYQDAFANGDSVSTRFLCTEPSAPLGPYTTKCVGNSLGQNFFSCWSLDAQLWSQLPVTGIDHTHDYLRDRCYANQAGYKYYIAVTGCFLFIGVAISVAAAFLQKPSIAVTATYFLAFSTTMLFILLWMYARYAPLSTLMILHDTDWSLNDVLVTQGNGVQGGVGTSPGYGFACVFECQDYLGNLYGDDKRALEWLHVLYSGVAGAVIGLVANWIALSVVTFFFEKEVTATQKSGQAGTAGL